MVSSVCAEFSLIAQYISSMDRGSMFSRISTVSSATSAPLAVSWGNCCVIRRIATVNPGVLCILYW